MVEPFDFDYGHDGSLSLESAVFQALGAASVCWENTDHMGIFKSDEAKQIGERLIEFFKGRR